MQKFWPLLMSGALLAACGQDSSLPGDEADTTGAAATSQPAAGAGATVAAASPANASTDPVGAPAVQKAAAVTVLPLRRGYYLDQGAPCSAASNAGLNLLRRGGIGGARDFCEFTKIEQTADKTYTVTEKCYDLQAGEESATTSKAVWTISNDTSFKRTSSDGWSYTARYCEQSSLPEPWSENDIGDFIK